jgi:hypothetical protein
MSLTLENKGGDFELAPEGTHPARCYRIIDLGTQQTEYKKGELKLQKKVILTFELLGEEKMEDDKPFSINQEYTASLADKAKLRAHLESWRGKAFNEAELSGFDIRKLLVVPCLVTVTHKISGAGNKYAIVNNVTKPISGMTVADGVNPQTYFEIEQYGTEAFTTLPEWIQKKVLVAKEITSPASNMPMSENPAAGIPGDFDQDVPF